MNRFRQVVGRRGEPGPRLRELAPMRAPAETKHWGEELLRCHIVRTIPSCGRSELVVLGRHDNLSECAQTYKHEKGRDRRKVNPGRSRVSLFYANPALPCATSQHAALGRSHCLTGFAIVPPGPAARCSAFLGGRGVPFYNTLVRSKLATAPGRCELGQGLLPRQGGK